MKKKLLILALAILLLPSMVFAKSYELNEFGFSEKDYESFDGVTETLDGGYVAVGYSGSYSVIVKYDKDDKIEWKKYDKTDSYFYDLDIDEDGYIYVAGSTYGDETVSYSRSTAYIVKLDKDGNYVKTTVVGDPDEQKGYFYDLEVKDGKIVAVGKVVAVSQDKYSESEVPSTGDYYGAYAVELDTDLNFKKEIVFDYDSEEEYYGVTLTSDGGFVAVGYTYSSNVPGIDMKDYSYIPIVVKYDKDGKQEWITGYPVDVRLNSENTCYYGSWGSFWDVIESCNGEYVVVGSIPQLTSKEAQEETASWEKLQEALGNSYPELDYTDKNIMYYESNAAVVVKYDKDGKKVSEYIENGEYDDAYTDILETNNCGYVVTGYIGHEENYYNAEPVSLGTHAEESLGWTSTECVYDYSDAAIRVFDKDLKVEFEKLYEGIGNDYLYNVSPVGEGEFVAVGYFNSNDIKEVKLQDYFDGLVVRLKIDYEITQQPTKNGIFLVAEKPENEKGYIVASPNEGYKVQSVKVVDSNGNDVIVTKNEDGSYTYDIYDDTWVTVTFVEKEIVENPKTGVKSFLLLGIIILVLGFVGYNLINKKQVFKRM